MIGIIRVAHASRVLVLASRQNNLHRKSAIARRDRQHARRVRYPGVSVISAQDE